MSAEDLTTQAGLSVQQDLALVNLLGIRHVERNGHHYVNGMAAQSQAEQDAFLAAHPDVYERCARRRAPEDPRGPHRDRVAGLRRLRERGDAGFRGDDAFTRFALRSCHAGLDPGASMVIEGCHAGPDPASILARHHGLQVKPAMTAR